MQRERRKRYIVPYIVLDNIPAYDILAFNELDALQKLALEMFSENDDDTFDLDVLENEIYRCDLEDIVALFEDHEVYIGAPYEILEGELK